MVRVTALIGQNISSCLHCGEHEITALIIQMIQPVPNSYMMSTIKKPAETGPFCGPEASHPVCFKNQNPEKYCINHNDPLFCTIIGDICDADAFVKPEDAYYTNREIQRRERIGDRNVL